MKQLRLFDEIIKSYIIDHDYTGKKYPTTKQKARCGNAVVPKLAEVLVRANLPELCEGNGKFSCELPRNSR